jgi:hypothetical protein
MGLRAVYAHIANLAASYGGDTTTVEEPARPAPVNRAAAAARRTPARRRTRPRANQ